MSLKKHIGLRVKRARLAAGLTQEALAEALTRSARTISSIESGQSLPSLPTLEQISSVLGKPLSYFFEEYGTTSIDPRRAKAEKEVSTAIALLPFSDLALGVAVLTAIKKHSGRS